MAPTLVATRTALDMLVPEALALRAVPMSAGTSGAPALSPEEANFSLTGLTAKRFRTRGGPVFSKSGEAKNCPPSLALVLGAIA